MTTRKIVFNKDDLFLNGEYRLVARLGEGCMGQVWAALEIYSGNFDAIKMMHAQGVRRVELFMLIAGLLSRAQGSEMLASPNYLPDPSGYMSAGINKALAYIRENLTKPFEEADLAAIAGQSTSAFSRAFRQHTGMSLVQYVKRLRINLACQILMSDEHASITDICFQVGFNNLSNFNRQFLAEKGMPPFGSVKMVTDNWEGLYAYLKGRSDGQIKAGKLSPIEPQQ